MRLYVYTVHTHMTTEQYESVYYTHIVCMCVR